MAARTRLDPAALMLALAGALVIGWMGLREFAFSDYELEALPSFTALAHGDVAGFFAAMPVYGGSLVIRGPFALLPDLWGGGSLAVYRSVAAPGLLAGVWLGLVLDRRMRAAGQGLGARRVALLVCAANPVSLLALQIGHPEEILGAALCVGAVLVAARDHAALAGLLLGLALANKAWAVLAVVPVLLALPRRRGLALAVAAAVAAVIVVPVLKLMDAPANFLLTNTSEIFQPWQVWWFAGETGHVVQGFYGVKPDYRAAPDWMSSLARPATLGLGLALALAWAWTGRRRPRFPDVLLLLAFVMLARCLVD
ncbi:MAG TPA: glycosyltransferase 87 family protein, partial [Vicinamibacteria bacterium]|nr:glycosyltransferase 87 family protein [Vicinamibacteria bacterium]